MTKEIVSKTLNDIFTKSVRHLVDGTAHSLISSAKNSVGYTYYITNSSEVRTVEKLLRKLDPKAYTRNSIQKDVSTGFCTTEIALRLREDVSYFIMLPEKTFIHVSRTISGIELFIFGVRAEKASQLFMSRLQTKETHTVLVETAPQVKISNTSFDSKGEVYTGRFTRTNAKSLDKIFTSKDNKALVDNYLTNWKEATSLFSQLSITHKLGILLYGPPGTGKSSMAKAIAHKLNYPIYTINVSSFPEVTPDLSELYEDCDDGFIILLEDIDYIFNQSSVERSSVEAAKANALLQMLDGVNSSSNVVFIATTNSVESLNSAIVRDGRFDLKIFMDNIQEADRQIAEEMCKSMRLSDSQTQEILSEEQFPINPAALQNKCVQYIFNHMTTWNAVGNGATSGMGNRMNEVVGVASGEVTEIESIHY